MAHRTGRFHYPIYQGKDRFHPTQKSLALFEQLIEMHCEPGDVVLDCFSGSGTTGTAAINTGRRYLGSEADPAYFARSAARLDAALSISVDPESISPSAGRTVPDADAMAQDVLIDGATVSQTPVSAAAGDPHRGAPPAPGGALNLGLAGSRV